MKFPLFEKEGLGEIFRNSPSDKSPCFSPFKEGIQSIRVSEAILDELGWEMFFKELLVQRHTRGGMNRVYWTSWAR